LLSDGKSAREKKKADVNNERDRIQRGTGKGRLPRETSEGGSIGKIAPDSEESFSAYIRSRQETHKMYDREGTVVSADLKNSEKGGPIESVLEKGPQVFEAQV